MTFHEPFRLAVPEGTPAPDLAGGTLTLPKGAKRLVPGSSWGAFTIACTVPIALAVGWYMYRFRKGRIVEASALGAAPVLGATVLGGMIPGSSLEPYFSWSKETTTYAIAGYGFVASILPVWLLLCPRDYLSSFLKIGTIALLVVGVVVANPTLEAPMVNHQFAKGGGPYFDGPIFPYVFICIMCGAVSGFHALVASGTTPKMVARERDVRMIGYGAMLMEGLVGIVALIAAAALPNSMYYDINIDLARKPQFQQALKALDVDHDGGGGELVRMERDVDESLHGRTGGAVTLAVGMSRIFTRAMPRLRRPGQVLVSLRDHVRGLVHPDHDRHRHPDRPVPGPGSPRQALEAPGRPRPDRPGRSWPRRWSSSAGATSSSPGRSRRSGRCSAWPTNCWPSSAWPSPPPRSINAGRARYAWATLVPMAFVATTTTTAGILEITGKFWKMTRNPDTLIKGYLNIGITATLLVLVAVILASALARWVGAIRAGRPIEGELATS